MASQNHRTFQAPLLKGVLLVSESITLPETNIAPENRTSQKETSIPTIHFQVLC